MDTKNKKRTPMKIIGIAIDCDNADVLADFYAQMLCWTKTFSGNGVAVISSPEHPSLLVFQAVENYQKPVWPWERDKQSQMMHFDFFVEDLDEAVEHAKACGAVISEVQFFKEGCVTMFDPAGHPFCLSTVWEEELYVNYLLALKKKESIFNENTEQFSIPGVGGIIIKIIDDAEHILLQTRCKSNAPCEDGLLEIPSGKIRAFESIFDALKREIKEETGLEVTEIFGEDELSVYEGDKYKVINFMPFSCSQNIVGDYPIMVFVFICRVTGDLLPFSDESKNYKWASISEIKTLLTETPEVFYPMHTDTLKKYINYKYQ